MTSTGICKKLRSTEEVALRRRVMYSDGVERDAAPGDGFNGFLQEQSLRVWGERIAQLKWENFRLRQMIAKVKRKSAVA